MFIVCYSVKGIEMKMESTLHSIFPSFFFCLICGISTICPWRKNGNWYLSESITFKLIHFFWIYLISIILLTSLIIYEMDEVYYDGLAGFVVIITRWTLIGQIYLNLTSTTATSKKLKSIVEDILFADSMIQENKINLHHKFHFVTEIHFLSGGVIYLLMAVLAAIITGNKDKLSTLPTTIFGLFYSTLVQIVYLCRFFMLMILLLIRYWAINREINAFKVSYIQNHSKRVAWKIQNLFEIYLCLNKAAIKLNEINQMRFLALIAGLFLINICTLFNAYYEYYIEKNVFSALNWFQLTTLVWLGFAELCFICHLTVNEAKRTGVILHKFLLENLDSVVSEKMLQFSNHILNTNPEYNVCGFFSIDCTLFYMLVGATFNYMIVMLQFEEGNNDNC